MGLELLLAQAVVNGIVVGMLYLLMAIGFTLAFGIMRIVNFAHGEFYMAGAFILYVCVVTLGLPFIAAAAVAFLAALGLGALLERTTLAPFRTDDWE